MGAARIPEWLEERRLAELSDPDGMRKKYTSWYEATEIPGLRRRSSQCSLS